MSKFKNTMVELVIELEKLDERCPVREKIIKLAKEGAFHDYRSKSVCGKMYFVEVAAWFDRQDGISPSDKEKMKKMCFDIKDGVYDEECTEEDKWIIIEETQNDPNMSEKDKAVMLAAFAPGKKKNGPFGKDYFQ